MALRPFVQAARRAGCVALFTLAAAASAQPAADASRTIRFVPFGEPTNFDPIMEVTRATNAHAYMIYDTLFAQDVNGKPQPQMVDAYTLSPDGRVYTMTLRKGMKFHDGSPVTANDAVASIRRWAKRDVLGKKLVEMGLQVDAVDSLTFTVATKQPTQLVLSAFAKPTSSSVFVMRAVDAAKEPTQQVTANIGSGPFRFVAKEYQPGHQIVYERNPDYVPRAEPPSYLAGGKRVNVDRVIFRFIRDAGTAVAALKAGEIDIYESPPPDLITELKSDPKLSVRVLDKGGISGIIRINHTQPPFDNPKVRQALLAAINQQDYVAVAGAGDPANAKECFAFLGCGFPGFSEAGMESLRKFDRERARRMLRESGYKGEPVLFMHPMDLPPLTDLTSVAIEHMKAAGFNVNAMSMDWATVTQRRAKKEAPSAGGWNAFLSQTYSFNMASPALNFFLAAPCQGGGWFGWPCDPKLEALRERWMAETDAGKLRAVEREIQMQAVDSVPFVPIVQFFTPVAYRNTLANLVEAQSTVFWGVTKGR
ncbi:MAG: ABC transporter substrate-binding protein [Burkholderiaceae bacterium]